MTALLKSARRKILGETWAIPVGVAATILLAYLMRGLLAHAEWQNAGAVALVAAIVATLIFSLPADHRGANDHSAAPQPDPNTTTRTTP